MILASYAKWLATTNQQLGAEAQYSRNSSSISKTNQISDNTGNNPSAKTVFSWLEEAYRALAVKKVFRIVQIFYNKIICNFFGIQGKKNSELTMPCFLSGNDTK